MVLVLVLGWLLKATKRRTLLLLLLLLKRRRRRARALRWRWCRLCGWRVLRLRRAERQRLHRAVWQHAVVAQLVMRLQIALRVVALEADRTAKHRRRRVDGDARAGVAACVHLLHVCQKLVLGKVDLVAAGLAALVLRATALAKASGRRCSIGGTQKRGGRRARLRQRAQRSVQLEHPLAAIVAGGRCHLVVLETLVAAVDRFQRERALRLASHHVRHFHLGLEQSVLRNRRQRCVRRTVQLGVRTADSSNELQLRCLRKSTLSAVSGCSSTNQYKVPPRSTNQRR